MVPEPLVFFGGDGERALMVKKKKLAMVMVFYYKQHI